MRHMDLLLYIRMALDWIIIIRIYGQKMVNLKRITAVDQYARSNICRGYTAKRPIESNHSPPLALQAPILATLYPLPRLLKMYQMHCTLTPKRIFLKASFREWPWSIWRKKITWFSKRYLHISVFCVYFLRIFVKTNIHQEAFVDCTLTLLLGSGEALQIAVRRKINHFIWFACTLTLVVVRHSGSQCDEAPFYFIWLYT